MKLEKIKFTDIVNDELANRELELLKGGILGSGCTEHICGEGNIDNSTNYCTAGSGICVSTLPSYN